MHRECSQTYPQYVHFSLDPGSYGLGIDVCFFFMVKKMTCNTIAVCFQQLEAFLPHLSDCVKNALAARTCEEAFVTND